MKKITRLHIILFAVLVAVVAAGVYYTFSARQAEAEQPDMVNEINMAMMRLETAKAENDPTEIKAQLAEVQKTLNSVIRDEPLFPVEPRIVEVGGVIVDARHKLELTLNKLKSDEDSGTETIVSDPDNYPEGSKYSQAEFDIEVQGDLGRIVAFIGEIEGSDLTTLVVEDVGLEYEEEYDSEEEKLYTYWIGSFTVVTLYEYQED
jgi:Na+-transporting NADH:ubiquinone oxidoreductase subunit NqrC